MKRLIKSLLKESSDKSHLALYMSLRDAGRITLILYSPTVLFTNLEQAIKSYNDAGGPDGSFDLESAINFKVFTTDIIAAYISLTKPENPCNGALEVEASAGQPDSGYGRYLYNIAMTLNSQNGLISDRSIVSQQAQSVWQKYYVNNNVNKKMLDDITNPQTPDLSDDCELHNRNKNFLNYSYSGVVVDMSQHQLIHEETAVKFLQILEETDVEFSKQRFLGKLLTKGFGFFGQRLRS